MSRSTLILCSGLAAAAALWLYSRTERGAAAIGDAIVTAERVASSVLPRGLRNNNPGNLRYIASNPWRGQVNQDEGGYGIYYTMVDGARAAGQQLLKYGRQGKNTVRTIISTWAPASENDTEAYIRRVANALGVAQDQRIDVAAVMPDLAWEIFKHECGFVTFTRSQSDEWVNS